MIAADVAGRDVQIVLTDPSMLSAGQEFGVLGGQSWPVADLSTKHAFLCAGLGWGHMPYWGNGIAVMGVVAGRVATEPAAPMRT
jgi:hypothetical protein